MKISGLQISVCEPLFFAVIQKRNGGYYIRLYRRNIPLYRGSLYPAQRLGIYKEVLCSGILSSP